MPVTQDSRRRSLLQRLWHWAFELDGSAWLKLAGSFVLSCCLAGIPATLEAIWRSFYESVVTSGYGELIGMTAPLTLSVGLLVFGWRREWWQATGPIPMAGAIVMGAWIGRWLGHPGAVEPLEILATQGTATLSDLFPQAINLLAGYLRAYGLVAFGSSLVVGAYLGRCWDDWLSKVTARIIELQEVVSPVQDQDTDGHRRAA